jgi:hypothetical protein
MNKLFIVQLKMTLAFLINKNKKKIIKKLSLDEKKKKRKSTNIKLWLASQKINNIGTVSRVTCLDIN